MIGTIEGFEYKGIWWPSGNPNNQVIGTLTYIPNQKASLDLVGFIDKPEIIHGISSCGKKITLYNISSMHSHHNYPGFKTSEYTPRIILVGEHFSEEIAFTSVSINYSSLDDWLDTGGFKESKPPEICVKYKKPGRTTAKLNEIYNISIDYSFSMNRSFGKYVNMKQTAYVIAESSEEKPLDEYEKIMYQTMNFLTLAIREPVYPLSINARTKSMNFTSESIMIYYPTFNIPTMSKSIHPLKMLFTFRDISKSFDIHLRNWFLKSNLLQPTFDLYFDTMYTSRLTIQTKFLYMVQALEAYHRRKETMVQFDLLEEEHSMRVESIIGVVPTEHKDWLIKQLEYSNQAYLSKRLVEILTVYEEIVKDFLPSKTKRKDFIGKVTDYRNTLTHYDAKKEPPRVDDLSDVYLNVKKIVELCLLTELGFDTEDILRLLNKEDESMAGINKSEETRKRF
ncbi:MAG: ApeA N-terminal domain 1-containing protein [Methanothrix sp.]